MKINSRSFLGNVLFLLVLFLIVSFTGLSQIYDYQRIVTVAVAPLTALLAVALNQFKLPSFRNRLFQIFFVINLASLLYLLGTLLSFQSELDIPSAVSNISKLAGVLVVIIIVLESVNYDSRFYTWYFLCFIMSFIIQAYMVSSRAGTMGIDIEAIWINRADYDLNANVYSYLAFAANFSALYLYEKYRRNIFLWLYLAVLALSLYVPFITVSRSGLIFPIIIAVLYVAVKYVSSVKGLIRLVPMGILGWLIFNKVYESVYTGSYLKRRTERYSSEGDSRLELIQQAIEVFKDHPFFGVGPGQFFRYSFNQSSFSHNSYVEMMSTLGISGLVLVCLLFLRPIWHNVMNSLRTEAGTNEMRDITKLNLVFFVAFALYNNLYVFYLNTYMMMFFFVIVCIEYSKENSGIQWKTN